MGERRTIATPFAGRQESVAHIVPLLWGCRTALYVGAKGKNGGFLLPNLVSFGAKVTVAEPWKPNADQVRLAFPSCDVKETPVQTILAGPEQWDVIVWWHGPEHVPADELPAIVEAMKEKATLVVFGCPLGVYPQSAVEGNPFDSHKANLEPETLEALGFSTITLEYAGGKGGPGTHITAWWRKEGTE